MMREFLLTAPIEADEELPASHSVTPQPMLWEHFCSGAFAMTSPRLIYEVRPRKDLRGVDLISDALPFGRLWYGRGERNQQRNRICQTSQPITSCRD